MEFGYGNLHFEKQEIIKKTSHQPQLPLLCWDIYMQHFQNQVESNIRKLSIDKIKAFSKKFNWSQNMDEIFLDEPFEAVILTDVQQQIIWVNEGFTVMTGYSRSDAMNRTPGFLQGELTSATTKERFRNKLTTELPFKEIILNYKKDHSQYLCEVKVFPLFTDRLTNYLALEKQVI